MTNLLTRLKNTIIADINETLERKEDKNPIVLLNHYLKESEKETEKVKQLLERQYLLKEQFQKEYKEAEEWATKRKQQLDIATNAGEEELAKHIQTELSYFEERVVRLQESIRIAANHVQELEAKYMEMKHKLKDMNIRRMELMGKENVSRAYHTINKVLNHEQQETASKSVESYLDTLEKKINQTYFHHIIDDKIAEIEKVLKK